MQASLALRQVECRHGVVGWREAGQGLPLVLLHGIGSGAMAWAGQIEAFAATHRVIAWDAPGYAESAPLPQPRPLAIDYAQALGDFLQRIGVTEMVLVGHSLGALMAAAFAAQAGAGAIAGAIAGAGAGADDGQRAGAAIKLRSLVLASPARGYGSAGAELRAAKWRERVELVERLGVAGMAAERAATLCAPGAPAAVVERLRWSMARVTPGGYAQAAHMLAHDDIATHLRRLSKGLSLSVLCGELDAVTPPAACARLADEFGASFSLLQGVAHACYVEDPARFNRALAECLTASVKA